MCYIDFLVLRSSVLVYITLDAGKDQKLELIRENNVKFSEYGVVWLVLGPTSSAELGALYTALTNE